MMSFSDIIHEQVFTDNKTNKHNIPGTNWSKLNLC